MKVLFIGATGLVGSHVIPYLKDDFDLTLAAINEGTVEGIDVTAVDICDWEAIRTFIKNGPSEGEIFDAVIYCATANYQDHRGKGHEARRLYYENCIEVNVRGAFHVYEAAWQARVPKVIHIGSNTSQMGRPRVESIGAEVVNQANDLYAATKIFGEQVGRSYAFKPVGTNEKHGEEVKSMQVLCLRLGQPFISLEQWEESPFKGTRQPSYVGDIARAISCALHSDVPFGIYSIVSAVDDPWILEESYAELGYTPGWKFTSDGRLEKIEPIT